MGNRERKEVRAQNNNPINFTCGVCMQVHEYKGNYNCPMAEDNEEKKEEEEK